MITVNIHQAKSQLSHLLTQIENHQEIVRVCRYGKPVADIVPIKKSIINPLEQHAVLQGVKIHYDPVAPLTEDEWQ